MEDCIKFFFLKVNLEISTFTEQLVESTKPWILIIMQDQYFNTCRLCCVEKNNMKKYICDKRWAEFIAW